MRELTDEKSLGSPVAFTEGVGRVDFTEIVGKSIRPIDCLRRLSPKVTLDCQLDERFGEVVFDVQVLTEATGALRHVDGAELTCSRIDVLKQVPMDRPEMVEIERRGQWAF